MKLTKLTSVLDAFFLAIMTSIVILSCFNAILNQWFSANYPREKDSFLDGTQHLPNFYLFAKYGNITNSSQFITEEELKQQLFKNCETNFSATFIKLNNKSVLPFAEYKMYSALQFLFAYANPAKKRNIRPTLQSYNNITRPDPLKRINNVDLIVNYQAVDKDVLKEKKRRMKLGDDDILKIPEVQAELTQTEYQVPNLIHFVWFGCSRFRVDHFITVLGGLKYQNPRLILFHTDCEPSGEYWDLLKLRSGKKLKVIRRIPPREIWGRKIKIVEHKADIARLQIMLEVGGIYLDTDSVVLRSLDELRKHTMVLSESNIDSLANGIIFANRTSWFLRRWYLEYKYFHNSIWGFNSVQVPWALWRIFPTTIYVVKELICRPNWQELSYIFHERYDWHHNYIIHLYSRYMKEYDGMEERPLKQLAVLNTTYGEVARHVIWGDERIRDVTDWIVTCNLNKFMTP